MSKITATISEHPARKDAFILDVERDGKLVVARDFHLGSRNDNFSRAVTQAEYELRMLLPDPITAPVTCPVCPKSCDNCRRNGNGCTHTEMPKARVCSGWLGQIAVPDAVPAADHIADTGKMVVSAPEPEKVCETCDHYSLSNGGLCLKKNIRGVLPNSVACVCHEPTNVPEPVPVVPVVRYWRHATLDSELCKTVGERITESIPANRRHIGQEIIDTAWLKITPAEYAAAKQPDHIRGVSEMVRIEPPIWVVATIMQRLVPGGFQTAQTISWRCEDDEEAAKTQASQFARKQYPDMQIILTTTARINAKGGA